ncbi:hypothetical protein N6B72_06045 [Chryseobacterium soli]|uniref:hypothetical protein n=1 Tax=Chryseobacterium soli TaxID=445961 RepID=UPI0029540381|nr:hypothetical protein [Chryseobacterium soli]MDV7696478.1 hypothetical protein [Chryseobacterium soli]
MKNTIKMVLAAGLLVYSQHIFSQQNVGIMTDKPMEKLHVSGKSSVIDDNIGTTGVPLISPTIRIDGLNMTNNPTVLSTDTIAPLYVDSNGDTSVKKGLETFGTYTQPGGDAITTATTLNVTATQTYQFTPTLLTASFTLQQRSVVYISSTLSADVLNASGGTITDGKNRAIAALISFTAAPAASGINTTSSYMGDGLTFANRPTDSMNGSFKLSPSSELVLPAGSYTVILRGAGIASSNAPGDNYRIIWGGGTGDKLNILAKPL